MLELFKVGWERIAWGFVLVPKIAGLVKWINSCKMNQLGDLMWVLEFWL